MTTTPSLSSSGDLAAHHSGQVARWFTAWAERDYAGAQELLDEQAVWTVAGVTHTGAGAVRGALEELSSNGWVVRADPLHIRADYEFAVAVVALRAEQQGGREVELPFETWWFRFRDGRLRELWSNLQA
jgi:ketosteroid isomerase-like protein